MQDSGLSGIANFLTDYWMLIKTYYSSDNWEKLFKDCYLMMEKYPDVFCVEMVRLFVNDKERRLRNGEELANIKN